MYSGENKTSCSVHDPSLPRLSIRAVKLRNECVRGAVTSRSWFFPSAPLRSHRAPRDDPFLFMYEFHLTGTSFVACFISFTWLQYYGLLKCRFCSFVKPNEGPCGDNEISVDFGRFMVMAFRSRKSICVYPKRLFFILILSWLVMYCN